MVRLEFHKHSTDRLEDPNPEKVEENDFKYSLMKMMETFKQEVKTSLKEMEEKTNTKLEEINKSLKDIQENQEKAMKQVRKQFNS